MKRIVKQQTINHSKSNLYSCGKRRGFFRSANKLLRKVFKKKKIVIISDKKIVSIPISTSMQAGFCLAVLAVTGWMSYSSGRYLTVQETLQEKEKAFQENLAEKENEIKVTNLTNKDLLSQVTDLQRNLLRISNYFENSLHGPEQDVKKPEAKNAEKPKSDKNALLNKVENNDVATAKDVELLRQAASETLQNIDQQIQTQIQTLQKAVKLTGLELQDVADINHPNNVIEKDADDFSAQGGPYFPAEDNLYASAKPASFPLPKNIGKSIDYLLQLEEVVYNLPLSKPQANARITSHFGKRADPFRRTSATHYGIDLAGPIGSKIYATAPGVVSMAQRTGAYGNMIELDHGNGIKTRYGHLSRILVHPGMKVQRGQVIGIQGSTGRSTGAHLHYEVRYNNIPRNPENFIKAGSYVFSQRKN